MRTNIMYLHIIEYNLGLFCEFLMDFDAVFDGFIVCSVITLLNNIETMNILRGNTILYLHIIEYNLGLFCEFWMDFDAVFDGFIVFSVITLLYNIETMNILRRNTILENAWNLRILLTF